MITVTEKAAKQLAEVMKAEGKDIAKDALRVFVQGGGCSGFQYGLMIDEGGGSGDQVFESNGAKVIVDPISINYLENAEIDYIDSATGGGFSIKNPQAKSTCGCGQSFSTEEPSGEPHDHNH